MNSSRLLLHEVWKGKDMNANVLYRCTLPFPRLLYIQKTPILSRNNSKSSFCTNTLLDKPPIHTRKDHPSILLLRRFQLDRRPTTSLKQVLPSRAIQVAIAQGVRPDKVIDSFATLALVLPSGSKYIHCTNRDR